MYVVVASQEKCQELSDDRFKSGAIALNTEVERISLDEKDPNVVIVECSNGRKILADHVILTVSVGVLRERQATMLEKMPISELKIRTINVSP